MAAGLIRAPRVEWYLCDLYSGTWLARVPVELDSYLCNLGEINRVQCSIDVAQRGCPPEIVQMLTPAYNKMMVLCLNGLPAQGWWIDPTGQGVEIGGPQIGVNMATLEACYDNANVPELYGVYDDAYAAAQLCIGDVGANGVATGLGGMGTRFGFVHEYANTGVTSDHDYSAAEAQTIYAALRSLMDDGRIEFRCVLRWKADRSGFTKVTQIRYRVGAYRKDSALTRIVGTDGAARGTIQTARRVVSGGATAVTGSATNLGSVPTVNAPVIAADLIAAGYPVVEDRKAYSGLDSVDDVAGAIRQRANATLATERGGVVTWSFVLNPGAMLPGADFDPGDTVPFRVDPVPAYPPLNGVVRPSPDPIGGAGDVRLLGYTMSLKDDFTVTPNIWQPAA